jgi:hypothetical protein
MSFPYSPGQYVRHSSWFRFGWMASKVVQYVATPARHPSQWMGDGGHLSAAS